MFVLTNSENCNGASAIFYPDILNRVSMQTGTDLIILPSSTHEVILVPDDGSFRVNDLERMVQNINRTEVAEKDQLSDHVYHYDASEKVFEKASAFVEREAAMGRGVPEGPDTPNRTGEDHER